MSEVLLITGLVVAIQLSDAYLRYLPFRIERLGARHRPALLDDFF